MSNVHIANNSGNNEWYTPNYIIETVKNFYGKIDLDPASCLMANEQIGASKIYTQEDNGLCKKWFGNVWINPPYSRKTIVPFCEKVVLEKRNYDNCILITNNATETKWFQLVLKHSNCICFLNKRVKFWNEESQDLSPLQGQVIFYLSQDPQRTKIASFLQHFAKHGVCMPVSIVYDID